mmetsp:Transcript_15632/g.49351  ORF Transcript_15632/g.49351 Transcript_15632/m.49351 type:complete len:361 (-) Transcript_15632:521-1603(-)
MLSTVFALPSLNTPPTVVSHAAHQPPEPTSSSSSSPRSLVRPPDERLTTLAAAHRDLLAILGIDEAAIRARVAERRHTSSAARHPRSGRSLSARFFSKTVPNHLPIRAHSVVPDSALFVASDRMSRQLRGLPPAVIEQLCRRGAALHLIGSRQVTTDLPEHRHLRGVRGALPGEVAEDEEAQLLAESVGRDRTALSPELERRRRRLLPASQMTLDERSRGMGGLQASCGEENLLAPEENLLAPALQGRGPLLWRAHDTCLAPVSLGGPSLPRAVRPLARALAHGDGPRPARGGEGRNHGLLGGRVAQGAVAEAGWLVRVRRVGAGGVLCGAVDVVLGQPRRVCGRRQPAAHSWPVGPCAL